MPGIFPLILPGVFPCWAQVVFSHTSNSQCCAEHIGGPWKDLWWSLCNFLLARTLSVTSTFFDLPRLSAPSLPLQEFVGYRLVCFSLHHSLDVPKAIYQGNHMSHLICFLSLKDHCFLLPSGQCHKDCSTVFFLQIFNRLR